MDLLRQENRGLEERLHKLENNLEVISAQYKAIILITSCDNVEEEREDGMWRKRERMGLGCGFCFILICILKYILNDLYKKIFY